MNANPEIIALLRRLRQGQIGRNELSRWFAEHSLRFLDSPNSNDRIVVAELDAALGEVQRAAQHEAYLHETARRLELDLLLDLETSEIMTESPKIAQNSSIILATSLNNSGGSSWHTPEYSYSYS